MHDPNDDYSHYETGGMFVAALGIALSFLATVAIICRVFGV